MAFLNAIKSQIFVKQILFVEAIHVAHFCKSILNTNFCGNKANINIGNICKANLIANICKTIIIPNNPCQASKSDREISPNTPLIG